MGPNWLSSEVLTNAMEGSQLEFWPVGEHLTQQKIAYILIFLSSNHNFFYNMLFVKKGEESESKVATKQTYVFRILKSEGHLTLKSEAMKTSNVESGKPELFQTLSDQQT